MSIRLALHLIFVSEVVGWWLPQSSLLGHLLALEKRLSLVLQMRILLLPVQNAQGKKHNNMSVKSIIPCPIYWRNKQPWKKGLMND
jgi:hypothetical protein